MPTRPVSIYAEALRRQEQEGTDDRGSRPAASGVARSTGRRRGRPRGTTRSAVRDRARTVPTVLPSKARIEEFSFALRNEPAAKVQAVVPQAWQQELGEIAQALRVEKLQLYRFILGEFLGKVRHKAA